MILKFSFHIPELLLTSFSSIISNFLAKFTKLSNYLEKWKILVKKKYEIFSTLNEFSMS